MRSNVRRRVDFEQELQGALDDDRFQLCYQPQIDLDTGEIVGAEALLRLRAADSSILSPSGFIPVAERTGQINSIGQMVLRSVLKQQRTWRNAGLHIRTSVNVSPCELLHPEYLATFERILAGGDFVRGSLLLEFTESESLQSNSHRDLLAAFKDMGVDLGIDDFGTGYSNLHYLRHLPIDVVKIDREFLQNTGGSHQDAMLLKAIINMARSLRRVVIAEGVETREQLEFLRDSACDQAQGFLFSPGVTPAELLSQWTLSGVSGS